jgi:hypothetical protein
MTFLHNLKRTCQQENTINSIFVTNHANPLHLAFLMIPVKHVFPDANVLLHFPAFDGLDWCNLCNAKAVVLHIAQPVMRELNKVKDTAHSKAVRRRATNVQRTLKKFLNSSGVDASLSSNVAIHLESHSPLVREYLTLDPTVADDALIAAVLTFRDSVCPDVAVITDDSGLALVVKATEWKIEVIEPPSNLRLPPEQDNDEKERTRLLQRIRELEESRADLDLHFAGGGSLLNVSSLIDNVDDDATSRLQTLREKYPKIPIPERPKTGRAISASELTLAELVRSAGDPSIIWNRDEQYNAALDRFFSKAEEVLRHNAGIKARTVRVDFEIVNNGPAPANDILAQIHFPDAAHPYKKENLSEILRSLPGLPENPSHARILPRSLLDQPIIPRTAFEPNLSLSRTVFGPSLSIRRVNSYEVSWKTSKLRQGHTETIEPLFVVFDGSLFSFEVSYTVVADNSKEIVR